MVPTFSSCVHSHIHLHYVQNVFPIGQAVWPYFPVFWILDPYNPPTNAALGYRGRIVLAHVHSQMNPQTSTERCANRSSRLAAFPDLNLWPPNTTRNAAWGIAGRIVFSLCPFSDESADENQSWWQSVELFDSFPRLLNVWPPKTTQVTPLSLEGQFVWRISIPRWTCTCVPNLVTIGSAVW